MNEQNLLFSLFLIFAGATVLSTLALLTRQSLLVAYMFLGLILTVVPGIIMNGILPLFGYDKAAYYGPNTVVIISVFLTLAIVKHRFLDIRLLAFNLTIPRVSFSKFLWFI